MMNRIFFWLVVIAFLATGVRELLVSVPFPAAETGEPWATLHGWRAEVDVPLDDKGNPIYPMAALTTAIFTWANKAVFDVALKLVGGMALMLGVMKVLEAAGGLAIMAKLIRPLMVFLFPQVPANHPAMGAMIMNLAANALGLGNAATPFGIKAMQELDRLNPHKGTATNAMALFLAINTSGVTLLATGVTVLRAQLGSTDPGGIIGTTLFATTCSTLSAVVICKLLQNWDPPPPPSNPIEDTASEQVDQGYPIWVTALALAGLAAFIPFSVFYGALVSPWLVPCIIVGFLAFGAARGVPVYETFIVGAKDGFDTAVRIIPYLVGILVMVGMLTSSGAMDAFTALVGPFTGAVGLPAEAIPMALIRPLSGSGASGVLAATLANPATGPDTYTGYLVSTIAGSTETTFYVIAVYYGAVQVQRIRHTLWCGLTADMMGLIGSVVAVQVYFHYVLGR
jgi:spore maturation protein SpmA